MLIEEVRDNFGARVGSMWITGRVNVPVVVVVVWVNGFMPHVWSSFLSSLCAKRKSNPNPEQITCHCHWLHYNISLSPKPTNHLTALLPFTTFSFFASRVSTAHGLYKWKFCNKSRNPNKNCNSNEISIFYFEDGESLVGGKSLEVLSILKLSLPLFEVDTYMMKQQVYIPFV